MSCSQQKNTAITRNYHNINARYNSYFNGNDALKQGKQKIAFAANSTLTLLFWHLGNRINDEVLHNERAKYGKRIIEIISVELENEYGRNFNEKNIRRMVRFSQEF